MKMLRNIWNEKSLKKFLGHKYKMRYRVPRLTKKRAARRKAGVYRRKRILRRGFGRQGGFYITRKLPLIAVSGTAAGTVALADPTTTCLSVGVPTLSTGFSNNVFDIPFTMKFQLNQLSEVGDITAICDQYKIAAAYIRLFYNNSNNAYAAQAGNLTSMPFVQYITDHDDGTLPTMSRLRSKMGVKMATFRNNSSYIGMKVRPKPSVEIFSSGSAYAVPSTAPYIDTTDDDVPHYAIKGFLCQVPLLDPEQGTAVFTFDVALRVVAKGLQ